ncbi:unnamed protein product [Phytophthora fragariaefolia]|uniref:Unnamed protein product n=1 Tax=Phytophthora fragariaefolia TaxID=1490495 RepID=A0A9W6XG88_9STRA|nr:unnamed protein product [Phytophthora fragariaefolia]
MVVKQREINKKKQIKLVPKRAILADSGETSCWRGGYAIGQCVAVVQDQDQDQASQTKTKSLKPKLWKIEITDDELTTNGACSVLRLTSNRCCAVCRQAGMGRAKRKWTRETIEGALRQNARVNATLAQPEETTEKRKRQRRRANKKRNLVKELEALSVAGTEAVVPAANTVQVQLIQDSTTLEHEGQQEEDDPAEHQILFCRCQCARRANMTASQTERRRAKDRERQRARRPQLTASQRAATRTIDRQRRQDRRGRPNADEQAQAQHEDQTQHAEVRAEQTDQERDVQRQQNRVRRKTPQRCNGHVNHEGFWASMVTGTNVVDGRHRLPPTTVCPLCQTWGVLVKDIRYVLHSKPSETRTYNLPTVSEVGVAMVKDGNLTRPRDLYVVVKDHSQLRLFETDEKYDPLQYPLLFPYGDLGWTYTDVYANGAKYRNKRKKSLREHVAYRLFQKVDDQTALHQGGRLFQQWVVDQRAKCEQEQLRWVAKNQKKLRAELYHGISDALLDEETITLDEGEVLVSEYDRSTGTLVHPDRGSRYEDFLNQVGKRIALPDSHPGSPRNMYKHYQESMAIVREYDCSRSPWHRGTRLAVKAQSQTGGSGRGLTGASGSPDLCGGVPETWFDARSHCYHSR